MKRQALLLSAFAAFVGFQTSAQVSEKVSAAEFRTLLQDNEVSAAWNDVAALNTKEKAREEDLKAVYSNYLGALTNLQARDEKNAGIISQEIAAVNQKLNSK